MRPALIEVVNAINDGSIAATSTDYTPEAYGAIADGITDCTTAIQSCFDAAIAAGGGTVRFSTGTYLITNSIDVTKATGLLITGSSTEATTIHQTGTHSTFSFTDVSHITLQQLSILGPGMSASGGGGITFMRENNDNTGYIHVSDVNLDGVAGTGIYVSTAILSIFENVHVVRCAGHAFSFSSGSTSTILIGCYGITCSRAGFYLDRCVYMTLVSCASEVCGVSYYLSNSSCISLVGCGCEESLYRSETYPQIDYWINGGHCNGLYNCYSRQATNGSTEHAIAYRNSGSTQLFMVGCWARGAYLYSFQDDAISDTVTENANATYVQLYSTNGDAKSPALLPDAATGDWKVS